MELMAAEGSRSNRLGYWCCYVGSRIDELYAWNKLDRSKFIATGENNQYYLPYNTDIVALRDCFEQLSMEYRIAMRESPQLCIDVCRDITYNLSLRDWSRWARTSKYYSTILCQDFVLKAILDIYHARTYNVIPTQLSCYQQLKQFPLYYIKIHKNIRKNKRLDEGYLGTDWQGNRCVVFEDRIAARVCNVPSDDFLYISRSSETYLTVMPVVTLSACSMSDAHRV